MAIEVIGTIVPKNNGDFSVVDTPHIGHNGGRLVDFIPVCLTQEEYNALVDAGAMNPKTPYMIVAGDSG